MKLFVSFILLLSTCICKIQSFTVSSFRSHSSIKTAPYFNGEKSHTLKRQGYKVYSQANDDLSPGIDAINSMNEDLEQMLNTLRDQHYFRLYSVDMLGSCEYMPQELFECYSETCEIYPVDEDEVSLVCICQNRE